MLLATTLCSLILYVISSIICFEVHLKVGNCLFVTISPMDSPVASKYPRIQVKRLFICYYASHKNELMEGRHRIASHIVHDIGLILPRFCICPLAITLTGPFHVFWRWMLLHAGHYIYNYFYWKAVWHCLSIII